MNSIPKRAHTGLARLAVAMLLVVSAVPFAAQPAFALYAYIHVNTSSDADLADGYCSLREAIIASNVGDPGYRDCNAGTTGIDRILIDVATVNVTHGLLPTFTIPAIIDSNLGGPRAEIQGDGNYTAFTFDAAADGSSITNLTIDNFAVGIKNGGADMTIAGNVIGPNSDKGIWLTGGNVTIGGANPRTPDVCSGSCNRISGNTNFGIYGDMNGSITGNLIGLDAAGTSAQTNGHGIDSGGSVTIGGATADLRNVVSGNTWWGVGLGGGCSCTIQGNYIGTNAAGTAAVANGTGVWVEGLMTNSPGIGATTVIGGTNAGEGNVISGNSAAGIFADKWGQYDSLKIQGNKIGVGSTGGSLGNAGGGIILGNGDADSVVHVYIGDPYNAAASNEIAYNTGIGVRFTNQYVTANYVLDDSIHDNTGKGIAELNGANDGIAPPVITGIAPVSGTACANCEVDVYSDSADEGKTYEGFTTADGSGNWTFSGTAAGPNVTALALTAPRGTSEFSAPVALTPAAKPDGRIRKGSGSFVGNNIYNTTGLNQTKSGSTAPGNTIKFGISIQNDGATNQAFKVHATGTAVTGYTVKYFYGSTNITTAVVAGTYSTPSLAPGQTYLITAKVKVGASAAAGSSVSRLVTITAVSDATRQDTVKFVGKRS